MVFFEGKSKENELALNPARGLDFPVSQTPPEPARLRNGLVFAASPHGVVDERHKKKSA